MERSSDPRDAQNSDPKRGDMWVFTSNNGDIVRHVKSVTRNGTVSYINNGRFQQCAMATWRRWARGAALTSREADKSTKTGGSSGLTRSTISTRR